jgi:hypothetical protein
MIVRFEGWPGTGLRLEDPKDPWRALDVGGTHGKGPMKLTVVEAKGKGSEIELEVEDVAALLKHCAMWLSWHHRGRDV